MKISELYQDVLESGNIEEITRSNTGEEEPDDLVHHFREFHETYGLGDLETSQELSEEELFEEAMDVTSSLNYDDGAVNKLFNWLKRGSVDTDSYINTEKPHVFASAALEQLEKDEIHITSAIGGLGYQNTKKLIVREGYDGNGAIGKVNTGELIIKGNAETNVLTAEDGKVVIEGRSYNIGQKMKGGEIYVEEDAYGDVGLFMKDGKILVGGDAGNVGEKIEEGEIHIEGDAEQVGSGMFGGEIYVEGDVQNAGFNMDGGEIRIGGDVEQIGSKSFEFGNGLTGGNIYVVGEIGQIVDPVNGAEIYQKRDNSWEQVNT